jgi:hypothetical protein
MRFPVPVRALAEDAFRRQLGDHGPAPPLLALVDVRQVHLDERHLEQFERIANRVAVVRPGARVDDDAARPLEGVMAPVDVLAFAVRVPAARSAAELLRPRVDLRLEIVQRDAAVQLGIAPLEHVQVGAVQDRDLHGAGLYPAIKASSAARTSSSGRSTP